MKNWTIVILAVFGMNVSAYAAPVSCSVERVKKLVVQEIKLDAWDEWTVDVSNIQSRVTRRSRGGQYFYEVSFTFEKIVQYLDLPRSTIFKKGEAEFDSECELVAYVSGEMNSAR